MYRYTFTIYDQKTDEPVDTVTVEAKNYLEADGEVDAWLNNHPGLCISLGGAESIEPVNAQSEQPQASYPHGYCPVCFDGGTGPQCDYHAAQIARILDPAETAARHRRLEQIGWKF